MNRGNTANLLQTNQRHVKTVRIVNLKVSPVTTSLPTDDLLRLFFHGAALPFITF